MDLNNSIEQIEGVKWKEPELNSYVVVECHRLRKIPLSEFTIENLRLLIGQKMSLNIILPLALDVLEENPFAEGNMYKGDLLANIINVAPEFWKENPELNNRLVEIKIDIELLLGTITDELLPGLDKYQFL